MKWPREYAFEFLDDELNGRPQDKARMAEVWATIPKEWKALTREHIKIIRLRLWKDGEYNGAWR